MLKKILPMMATVLLAACATTPMQGESPCAKAQHKCECKTCECKDCGTEKCQCPKKADGAAKTDGEKKQCDKKKHG